LADKGVGARLLRKEDDRFLRGRGKYIGDFRLDGMRDVAFVRSPVAHARLTEISVPEEYRDTVFTARDLDGVRPIRAVSGLPGFKISEQPPLALDLVRQVGELIAICVADSRAEAEDIAEAVMIDFEELPAVTDMVAACAKDAPLVHRSWGDNIYLETGYDGDIAAVAATAPVRVSRELRTSRQCMAPIECRGFIAEWDTRLDQLVVHGATQFPHVVRTGLSECLGLAESQIRVISPDVGGGFGYKAILAPEEVCLCWLAMRCGHPVRWLEDRREHLTANANCREHHYRLTAYADRDGRLLGFDAEGFVDSGAYSSYPFTAAIEASQLAAILPGPYDIPVYRCKAYAVATNKAPILPYRGVARPGVCFAMELMIDALAREIGKEPHEVRLANLVGPEQMPFDNVTDKHFDSGDYPECLRRAVAQIDIDGVRRRQAEGEADGRLIGVGLATLSEQTAHGTTADGKKRALYEQASARLTPDGRLDIRVGVHTHGQGLETTLAQIANEILGIDPDQVRVLHGDTELSPYSTGTWGSRCMVWAGGATARACREIADRVARIGAALLQTGVDAVRVENGAVIGPAGSVSLRDIARAFYLAPQDLPEDIDARGLEATEGYAPARRTGIHTVATHAAVVAVDPETGAVEILDYVVIEDAGTLVNPMIVDGQILGGTAQGIGSALYEEMPFSAEGQPLASTFADYLLPGATEVPDIRLGHMTTPSPYTEFGVKGVGEGGAIGPPAALTNAVNDALRPLGAEMTRIPMTPHRILRAIIDAGRAGE
jgi:aerobic carbon-monoxide dehydrogenase large subunit